MNKFIVLLFVVMAILGPSYQFEISTAQGHSR
jgi:hypothetical protein